MLKCLEALGIVHEANIDQAMALSSALSPNVPWNLPPFCAPPCCLSDPIPVTTSRARALADGRCSSSKQSLEFLESP